MAQGLDRIERIGEAAPVRGLRHELCNALGTFGAHGCSVETTLLPNNAGEKLDGQSVLRRRLLQCTANLAGTAWRGCWLLVA
jgi:hypothetical protein